MIEKLKEGVGTFLPKNKFARSVGVLVGGTAGSQAIMVLVLPILTRLYTPDDFAILAVYTAIIGMLASVACLRLEIAIPIPESEKVAINLLALALIFPLIIAFFVWFLIIVTGTEIEKFFSQDNIENYFWVIPLGIWFSGSYDALQYWATRKSNFTLIAYTRLTQAVGGAGTQLVFGIAGIIPLGLLLGSIISIGAGIFGLGRDVLTKHFEALRAINLKGMRSAFSEYQRFPKYSTFEAFANTGGAQIPVLLIASFVAGPEVGFLMLATRALDAPMGLISKAVSQVYLSTASSHYRNGLLGSHTAAVIGGLLKTGVGPLIFAGITAPHLFPVIFGSEWQRSGELVAWLTPCFIVQLLVSPVSMTLHVSGKQAIALMLQVVGLALRTGAVIAAGIFFKTHVVEVYALSGFLFYSIYLFVVARIAEIKFSDLRKAVPIKIIFSWIMLSYVFLWMFFFVADLFAGR